jgi:hypothetical protein
MFVTHRHRASLAALQLLMLALSSSAYAQSSAETSQACASNFENGQRLRKDGKIKAAADALIACSQTTCPSFIAKECTNLYTEAQEALPSVSVQAKDGLGQSLFEVKVYVDGKLAAEKLDGRAISLDPGMHEFRFERPGSAPQTLKVLVNEGEKHKIVSAELAGDEVKAAQAKGETSTTAAPQEKAGVGTAPSSKLGDYPAEKPMSLVPAFIAAGVGVAAIGVGTYFHFAASSAYDDANKSCSPNCSDKRISSIDNKYLASEISWGVGGAALMTSAVLFIVRASSGRTESTPPVALELMPSGQYAGGYASYRGTF